MTTTDESVDEYLDKHQILTYLQDAVEQLLEYKDENPKVVSSRFFFDYFSCVKEGNHILFRDYQFIKSTPHNRGSFISLFLRCFRHIGKRGDLMTIAEYNSLIRLLCSDFPFSTLQNTAIIILMEDAVDSLVSFSDFIYAFQIQFYYEEFLTKCHEIYQSLLSSPPKDTVVVPTSETPASSHEQRDDTVHGDSVDSPHFYKLLNIIIEKASSSCPSNEGLDRLLNTESRISYYGFLHAMSKCEIINHHIGILPCPDELYWGVEDAPSFETLTESTTDQSKTSLENASTASITSTGTTRANISTEPQTSTVSTDKEGEKCETGDKVEKEVVRKVVKKKYRETRQAVRAQKSTSDDDDEDDTSSTSSDD